MAATVAGFQPIWSALIAVFLFAGPHNWVELRYFLTQLPSKFGPLKTFFAVSVSGVLLLGNFHAALGVLAREELIQPAYTLSMLRIWAVGFWLWLASLLIFRWRRGLKASVMPGYLCACAVIMACSLMSPVLFGYALVYLHPLVALAVLDREIARRKREWLAPYRAALLVLPVFVLTLIWTLSGSSNLPEDTITFWQVIHQAGSGYFTNVSSHLLLSLHTFLEMLHYGVWLCAIPLVSPKVLQTSSVSLPICKNHSVIRVALPFVLLGSTAAVISLWTGFGINYSQTWDFYFTVAIFHVLAELPVLLWLL